jgi:leucyl aminopeptidase (aminopeptidase T)
MVTDKVITHYTERAKGGVGVIFVEGTCFTPEGKGYVRQIGLALQEHVEGLKRLTAAVHGLKNDTRIFLQIHHAGGRASSKVTGLQPLAPSAVPPYPGAEMPRALTHDQIAGLIEAHVEAGKRGCTMCEVTEDALCVGAIEADYEACDRLGRLLGAALAESSEVRITTPLGTDIRGEVKGAAPPLLHRASK